MIFGDKAGSHNRIRVTEFANPCEGIAAVLTAMTDKGHISFYIVRAEYQLHLYGLRQVFQHLGFRHLLRQLVSDEVICSMTEAGTFIERNLTRFFT
jgi:hypothetical protein